MAELANYITFFGPILSAVLAVFGGFTVTLSPKHNRVAWWFFLASAIPVFLAPIAYGYSIEPEILGIAIAAISDFILGIVYYIGLSILSDHIRYGQDTSDEKSP